MKRVAIFAHHGPAPQVARHVLYHVQQLSKLGFQLWFVSNSAIAPESRDLLARYCERILERENRGLDFGMWRFALVESDLSGFDELLLTNSSIIGPVQPLAPFWQHPAIADCDFWGLTDNSRFAPHLQSYFLVFRRRVLHSQCFKDFWPAVLPYADKLQVVLSYEVGLTRWLEEGGFTWKPIFPQARVWAEALRQRSLARKIFHFCRRRELPALDVTNFAYEALLQAGMPYIKFNLMRDNNWLPMSPEA
jgi:lipopolysaccharide biosynthesis protein